MIKKKLTVKPIIAKKPFGETLVETIWLHGVTVISFHKLKCNAILIANSKLTTVRFIDIKYLHYFMRLHNAKDKVKGRGN